ncbi:MAG: GDSL-type esterase/lipase family protein [Siphonobacter sp.]
MKFCLILSLSAFIFLTETVSAQQPFAGEIQAFEKQDQEHPPLKKPIVFVGSSTFRLWPEIQSYFPGKPIINRGFGGSQLSDVIYYYQQLIPKYHAKQIVIYCGDNDLANGQKSVDVVYNDFVTLFTKIRQDAPKVAVLFVSIKPSPANSRWTYREAYKKVNRRIMEFLAKQKNARFLDIWPVMLNASGEPDMSLFKPDSVHMLPEGYRRWAKLMKPLLK